MAIKVWRGTARDIAQITKITVGGTWAQGDLARMTVNDNQLVVTLGATTSVAHVCEALANAVNANSTTDNLADTESRNVGGQSILEYTEFAASATSTTVDLTAVTAGKPFTVTASPSSAAGTESVATPTAATGKNFWTDTANWNDSALPVSNDQILFQEGSVDCLYGLEQSALTGCILVCESGWEGRLGLPVINAAGYAEYRPTHLEIGLSAQQRSLVIGEGNGSGSPRLNINVGSSSPKATIYSTAPREDNAKAAVDLLGGSYAMSVSIARGSLSLAATATNTASVATLELTYVNQVGTDAEVYVGETAIVREVVKVGGFLQFMNTPSNTTLSTVTNHNGVFEFNGAGALTYLRSPGGEVRYNSTGALGTPIISGAASLDFSRDPRTKTVTNPIERFSDTSVVNDPAGTVSNLRVDNNNCSDTSNLHLGSNFRLTRGAVA